jgi:alcohol dehydrogenase class IV
MEFEFSTATRIIFGIGKLEELGLFVKGMGSKALIVTQFTPETRVFMRLAAQLEKAGITYESFSFSGEPTVEFIEAGLEVVRNHEIDMIIGLGGGSAIDGGKAIAALAANPGDLLDYLEVIGAGKTLTHESLAYIAIPTTAGTGAEVTRNAVIGSKSHGVKVSLRSPLMLPKVAVVDPELTVSLPAEVTASTGMDALAQLIEPYVSNASNPLIDAICREGMRRAARSLRTAFHYPNDIGARQDLSLASLFSGLALANSKLGAVHGFAGVIGGRYQAPHGMICARLLPVVFEINLAALEKRDHESRFLDRYDEIGRLLTGHPRAEAQDGVTWLFDLREELIVPGLGAYGISRLDFDSLIQDARQASSMKGNPIVLSEDEMREILEKAY